MSKPDGKPDDPIGRPSSMSFWPTDIVNQDGTPSAYQGLGSKLLSPVIRQQIISALQRGMPQNLACAYAGISPETLRSACARGRAEDAPEPWRGIYLAVENAKSEATMRSLDVVDKAQADDWRAAAWRLERTRPQEFGRTVTEIQIGDKKVTDMSEDEHQALILDFICGQLEDRGRKDLGEELRKALK